MKSSDQTKFATRLLIALFCVVSVVASQRASAGLIADGRFSPTEGYSVSYWVEFPNAPQSGAQAGWAGATGVGRGFLALGTDSVSGNHFLYYALPKGYVDNTYRGPDNLDQPPIVGIYEGSTGHKLGTGLIGSDNFGVNPFELYHTNPTIDPNGPLDHFRFTVDYLADVKATSSHATAAQGTRLDIQSAGINGTNDALTSDLKYERRDGNLGNTSGHQNLFVEFATSMEWNLNTYGPSGTNAITASDIANLSGYLENSPDVVRDGSGQAVLATDGYSYQANNPLFPDWIYEVAYEMEFDSSLFGAEWADPSTLVTDLLQLPNPHASPNKGLNNQGDIGDPVFIPIDPQTVPEPASGAMWALVGLLVTIYRRYCRKRLRCTPVSPA